ncbi:porin family protein [Flavobacterium restrictum]|uniref:PorT family protein n=1 Tax=Flavobacterium restrictum TaxID=2594428 RepID=A0A553E473_9FLAO|nr:porin family protein [Flavobacterium restrictum]TRX39703.1 PorT family protein [Flavobacterium restrictum]
MKKIILAAVAVLVFGTVNAQKAKFGIKAGLNLANQSFTGIFEPSTSATTGFNVGGFVAIDVADKLVFQPELLYSTQGSKFDQQIVIDGVNYVVATQFKLAYLNVPLMMKYYAAEKFSFEAGPQIGFLTSAKIKASYNGNSNEQDAKDGFKSIDFGVNFGLGYDFSKNISLGARYNLGLSNTADTDPGEDVKIKNNVFSISLGYKF